MLKLKRVDLPSSLQLGLTPARALIVPHDRETVDFSLISRGSIPALKSRVFRSPSTQRLLLCWRFAAAAARWDLDSIIRILERFERGRVSDSFLAGFIVPFPLPLSSPLSPAPRWLVNEKQTLFRRWRPAEKAALNVQ